MSVVTTIDLFAKMLAKTTSNQMIVMQKGTPLPCEENA
jgi:hypothetical protein